MNTHEEYKRIHNNGGTALLFLHGILGTPRHFDFLLPLVPEDWSVHALLLPGHGGSTADFGRSSMHEWKSAVEKALTELCEKHERVFIVGHSMGTLLAVHAAMLYPEKVVGIFALAMPLKIHLAPSAIVNSLHTAFRPEETDSPLQRATREACSVALSKNPLAYIGWIPRFLELFALSRETLRTMPCLKPPCFAIQSAKDELVSPASLKHMGKAKAIVLLNSSHYFYRENDLETIKTEFKNFIST